MADHLGRCLNAQLDGIYIHGCEGRRGEPGEQGIIKGNNGDIPGNGQPQPDTCF